MEKFTFDNIPDPNQNEELRETINIIKEIAKQNPSDYNEVLAPAITDLINNTVQPLIQSVNTKLLDTIIEFTDFFPVSEAAQVALELMKSFSNNLVLLDLINQSIIEFTKDDIQTVDDLNIDLDEYSNKLNPKNSQRIFSKDKIIELIGLLFALIALIQGCIYHIENNNQSQETAKQIDELNESQKRTNELLETIIRQISTETSESTDDEISNPD